MNAKELADYFELTQHPENGRYKELYVRREGASRAKSGYIYYYVDKEERTRFHKIDSQEYWAFNAGATLEIWIIDDNGEVSVKYLGKEKGCQLAILCKANQIFATRYSKDATEGTFVTCITVPRFSEDGFVLYEDKEIMKKYPKVKPFFD